ncbi:MULTISPECIES: hypothetical protein [Carboxydocella]|uniref:Uncharacterized protein n=2 Tax=Carboxydocella TaxID=178898 RepID=A0A1T4P8W5_9FIRM|nr:MULTISPECIES: hypothetical protein [Carboxydocella]AVX20742.1 hypothetical protein CFE_1564 [Carboxydocella thermautotrophica]GAW28271.1 hypothetical protein ULO1_08410 [Carboxydocella sp. ULO1]GAW32158.1 hypothetical protein JDF658_19230 [Carboxydocella sp. JDF658]SJZ87767.1 hypothetical protein SAMN02745885_01183 [Carboxydocella sporoproducens DSM 16521]
MSIKPVDMQNTFIKVQEVSKIQQTELAARQQANQEFSAQLDKQTRNVKQKIQASSKTLGSRVRKKTEKDKEKQEEREEGKKEHLDILV